MAVTNTMEKARLGVQQMGKLNFTQMTELVKFVFPVLFYAYSIVLTVDVMHSCSMNRGLPSCLASEDPSTSYHVKGLDIAAGSFYLSPLR